MTKPQISVIMAVYNGEKHIAEAVESVLTQTFPFFELLIVDDASTDKTPQILKNFNDDRIHIVRNSENKERSYSRNRAIEMARGEFIAVLDADDVCLPDRFEKQIAFFNEHPELDVLGGEIIYIDEDSCDTGKKWFLMRDHQEIVWNNLFYSPIPHSTAMIRSSKLREVQGYDVKCPPCEDADLWIRLSKVGAKFANLKEPITNRDIK